MIGKIVIIVIKTVVITFFSLIVLMAVMYAFTVLDHKRKTWQNRNMRFLGYKSIDEKIFDVGGSKFSQNRMFKENTVFVRGGIGYDTATHISRWSTIYIMFYNETEEAPIVQLSEFTVKDAEGVVVLSCPDILLDQSNLTRRLPAESPPHGYYVRWLSIHGKFKNQDIREPKYYVSYKLDGQQFYDVIELSAADQELIDNAGSEGEKEN